MNKKVLYVSNGDPSQLLGGLRNRFPADYDSANNREETFSALITKEYDIVIITDLALAPGSLETGEVWTDNINNSYKNGIRVARRVKEKGLLLYVLTSSREEYREELIRIGTDGVFKKVIEYKEFLDALKAFFNREL